MSEKETMLTTEELADRWGFKKNTLLNWRYKKRGPKYIKMGDSQQSLVLYRLKDIEAYENENTFSSTNSAG